MLDFNYYNSLLNINDHILVNYNELMYVKRKIKYCAIRNVY